MKSFIFASLLLSSTLYAQSISAVKIMCVFTEPFLTVTYSVPDQNLSVRGLDYDNDMARDFSIRILTVGFPGEFVVVGTNGDELLKFSIDGRGSDGMSDEIYPISATLNLSAIGGTFSTPDNLLSGGCRFAK